MAYKQFFCLYSSSCRIEVLTEGLVVSPQEPEERSFLEQAQKGADSPPIPPSFLQSAFRPHAFITDIS